MRREGTPARMQAVEPCRERRPRMPVAAQAWLYHPALTGTPPEEGNWEHLGGLFLTPLYHPALAGTPPEEGNWEHLGGLLPTPLYHPHPCGRAFAGMAPKER